jgi:hypothetical protein
MRWSEAAAINDDWYKNHPYIGTLPANQRIPIGMHGDDAGVSGQNQVFTLTWGSISSRLPTLDSRIIFTMVRTGDMVAGSTMDQLLSVFVWSLRALSEGRFPEADHLGNVDSLEISRELDPDHRVPRIRPD